jgi:hypothetical protein
MMSEAKKSVYEILKQRYEYDADKLLDLCCLGSDTPIYADHLALLCELASLSTLDDLSFREIQTAYVLLSAFYVLQDAVVDNHMEDKSDILYLAHMISASCVIFEEVTARAAPRELSKVGRLILYYIAENARAIQLEQQLYSTPLEVNEEMEYECIVGRSNSSLLLYRILCLLGSRQVDERIERLLRDYIVCLQWGDDLGDWRADLLAKRWTSTLRTYFARIGSIPDEETVEGDFYLSGYYEERAGVIIQNLDRLINEFERIHDVSSQIIRSQIKKERGNMYTLLTDFISTKLLAQSANL